MAETKKEMLARIRREQGIVVLPQSEVDLESGLTMSDRAKLAATGLLFNYADEAIAGIKALSPNVTYKDALAGEREQIKAAQEKDGSLKYEIGGALIPTAAAMLAAPFTGGTSALATAPTWARLLGIGAAQGFAMGTGASEEEGLARIKDAPVATITGAVLNPTFAKLSGAIQRGIAPILDSVKKSYTGQVGRKVEDEIIRMVQDSGLTVDEFILRVQNGEILPEMSEQAAEVVAGFANKAGPGGAIIKDAVFGRKNKFVKELYETLQNDLAPDSQGGNIFKTFSDDAAKLKKAEGEAYEAIWESTAGQSFKEIDDVVLGLATSSKSSRARIAKYFDDSGFPSPFKMVGKGKEARLELTRSLSLFEGELVKRAFMDAKDAAGRSGTSNKQITMGGYERQIKNVLDKISPDLQTTRQNWATISNSVKQYDLGKKVFGQNPEEFAVAFQKLVDAGDTDAIEALRAGAASALKLKSKSSSATGTVKTLADADINQKQREILETLYPNEKIDDIILKINRTRSSIVAATKAFGGSDTAGRIAAGDRVGQVKQNLADAGRIFVSNGLDVGATTNIITRLFGGKKPPFTDDQFKEIAELVISDNPELLTRKLTDTARVDAMLNAFKKAIDVLGSSQPRVQLATSVTEGVGDAYDPVVSGTLESLISTISPSAREKIKAQ